MNFEFKDAGSGLLWAHAKVNYMDFVTKDINKEGGDFEVDITMVMEKDFGRGRVHGKLKLRVDYLPLDFKREVHKEEFFLKKRAQHWTTFPLLPISTGQVGCLFHLLYASYS